MKFETTLRVRFSDVDRAGIAYYPRVVGYFHEAMEEFFEKAVGVPYAHVIERDGLGFPTVALETQFLKPLHFGESVTAEVTLEKLGRTSVVFRYRLLHRDGTEQVTARVTTVCVELKQLRPVPVPEAYRQVLARYVRESIAP